MRVPPPTIAVVTNDAQPHAGHGVVLADFVAHLRDKHGPVTILNPTADALTWAQRAERDGVRRRSAWAFELAGVEIVRPGSVPDLVRHTLRLVIPRAARRLFRSDAGPAIAHLGRELSPTETAWLASALTRLDPDVVVLNSVYLVPEPGVVPARAVRYTITHDVMSARGSAFVEAGYEVRGLLSPYEERSRLERGGAILAISVDDAAAFADLLPGADILVVPVSMRPPQRPAVEPVVGRVLFVGSDSAHNVDGLEWFLQSCWPDVLRQLPSAELHVAGSVGDVIEAAASMTRLGRVRDLAAAYASASAVIVPLRIGSGMKVKLVEAIVHGRPTVTTSVGAQGLLSATPRPFVLADDSRAFADRLVEVLTDAPTASALERACETAAAQFEADRVYDAFDRHLTATLAGRRTSAGEAPA